MGQIRKRKKRRVIPVKKRLRKGKGRPGGSYLKKSRMLIPMPTVLEHNLEMVSGMHDSPVFSFIAPAIRDYFYEDFYHSLYSKNNVAFEIIFVGDTKPIRQMPDNFHYIETEVKTSQCYEIAAMQAKGEFLILTGDDIRYCNEFLNKMLAHCRSIDMDNSFVYFTNYTISDKKRPQGGLIVGEDTWFTAESHVIKKDVWSKIGGFDRRYWGPGATNDMQQRLHQLNFKVSFMLACCSKEVENTVLIGETGRDRLMIAEFHRSKDKIFEPWIVKDGVPERIPFLPFDDEDILIKDQN